MEHNREDFIDNTAMHLAPTISDYIMDQVDWELDVEELESLSNDEYNELKWAVINKIIEQL